MSELPHLPFHAMPAAAAFAGRQRDHFVGDGPIATTRLGLVRLALVAAETASRYEREGIAGDPMDWLLAPRRLFGGRCALDACLEREHGARAVLLHGLAFGMDAEPRDLDDLLLPDDAGGDGVTCSDGPVPA